MGKRRSVLGLRTGVRILACTSGLVLAVGTPLLAQQSPEIPNSPRKLPTTIDERFIAKRIDGAAEPHLVPDAAAIRLLSHALTDLHAKEAVGALDALKQALALSDDEFARLTEVSKASSQRAEEARNAALASLCRDGQNLEGDAGARELSAALSRIGRETEDGLGANFKSELRGALGAPASQRVLQWMDANLKPSLKVVEFDTAAMSAGKKSDPIATFRQNCRSLGGNGAFSNSSGIDQ